MIPDLLRQQPNTTKIVTLQSKANAAISSAFACAALPSKCTLMLEADFSRVEDYCSYALELTIHVIYSETLLFHAIDTRLLCWDWNTSFLNILCSDNQISEN